MQEHVNDHWVKEATRLGYRSRAAFKLLELAEKDKLLRPGMSVVDLGSGAGKLGAGAAREARTESADRRDRPAADGPDSRGHVHPGRLSRADEGSPRVEAALGGRQGRPCRFRPGPQSVGCGRRRTRRVRCISANWRSNSRSKWLQPGGDLVVKAFQGSGFEEFQRVDPEPFRQGLRPQTQGLARSQPGGLSGREAPAAESGVTEGIDGCRSRSRIVAARRHQPVDRLAGRAEGLEYTVRRMPRVGARKWRRGQRRPGASAARSDV